MCLFLCSPHQDTSHIRLKVLSSIIWFILFLSPSFFLYSSPSFSSSLSFGVCHLETSHYVPHSDLSWPSSMCEFLMEEQLMGPLSSTSFSRCPCKVKQFEFFFFFLLVHLFTYFSEFVFCFDFKSILSQSYIYPLLLLYPPLSSLISPLLLPNPFVPVIHSIFMSLLFCEPSHESLCVYVHISTGQIPRAGMIGGC